ncbi:Ubiquinone+biosynthesis+O-methyltransferase,+mitochondrial [Methylocapsa aurea]|uniref:class I SAM-dependent methyltransferase n=1 Tax=Methylocapsa aurea TaxID=663610 RepID=UPI003D188D41
MKTAPHDYDANYRHLRQAGFRGWAGEQFERGLNALLESFRELDSRGLLPRPPVGALEIGCGNAAMWSQQLARRGYIVSGIDIAPTAIQWAKDQFASANLDGSFFCGDVRDMAMFEDGVFDLVVDGSCLHCLIGDDRRLCLEEALRVLAPNGVFVLSSMCGTFRSSDARLRFDAETSCLLKDGEPYRTLKPASAIEEETSRVGFDVLHRRVNANPWWDHITMVCRRSIDRSRN